LRDFLIATGMHICFQKELVTIFLVTIFFNHSDVKRKLHEICHRT